MARYGERPDLIDQVRRLQEQVRRLQTKSKPVTTHTKTFLVSGSIPPALQTPPFIVSTSPMFHPDDQLEDTYPQDVRSVTGVNGKLLDGEAWLDFYVNDVKVYDGLHVTAAKRTNWEPVLKDLFDGDLLSVVVDTATETARDLSAAFMMTLESWE